MNRNETERNQRLPLTVRLQIARGRYFLPFAVGLRDVEYFETVGKMTGEEEKYARVYESYIKEHGSTGEKRVGVFDLVAQAEWLDEETQEKLLYLTLIEPFAAISKAEQNQKGKKE